MTYDLKIIVTAYSYLLRNPYPCLMQGFDGPYGYLITSAEDCIPEGSM